MDQFIGFNNIILNWGTSIFYWLYDSFFLNDYEFYIESVIN